MLGSLVKEPFFPNSKMVSEPIYDLGPFSIR